MSGFSLFCDSFGYLFPLYDIKGKTEMQNADYGHPNVMDIEVLKEKVHGCASRVTFHGFDILCRTHVDGNHAAVLIEVKQ